jgi:hypothetical protein
MSKNCFFWQKVTPTQLLGLAAGSNRMTIYRLQIEDLEKMPIFFRKSLSNPL